MGVSQRSKKLLATGALVVAGFGAGVGVAVTGSATAATDAVSSVVGRADGDVDPSRSINPDEELLTGETAERVRAAVLAEYPQATIQRVETDDNGVYEAHVVTAAGEWLEVEVGEDFAVTGTEEGHGGPGGHHGQRGPGGDDRAPQDEAPQDDAAAGSGDDV